MNSDRTAIAPLAVLLLCVVALVAASTAQAAGTVNGVIAYEVGSDIYTVNPDGTNKTRISGSDVYESQPEYSPDGTQIALDGSPNLKFSEVYVMDSNGKNQTRLTFGKGTVSVPTWTSDGSRILFLSERDNDTASGTELYSIAPDGSGETLLATDGPSLSNEHSISTAGDRIAYSNNAGEVVVMSLDGSGKTILAPDPALDANPQLSPDASTIAFTSERGATEAAGLFTMTVAGANVTELEGDASVTGFSPDGTKILYTGTGPEGSAAKVINADGTGAHRVSGKRFSFPQEFSPDSQRVSLSEILPRGGEDPYFSLLNASVAGGNAKRITQGRDGAEYGDWQPVTAPAPTPALSLKAKAGQPNRGVPQARVTCSNECDVVIKASDRIDGISFRSKTEAAIYGGRTESLAAIGDKSLKLLKGKSGSVEVKVVVTDDFGQRAKATIEVELAG